MKKENIKKKKKSICLSFDNLAIPEVHLHSTSEEENSTDNENASENNEVPNNEMENASDNKTKKKPKTSISFDSVAIPEIHIKK